jgi:hypothetical protein
MKTGFIDWEEDNLNFYVFEKKGGQYELSDSRSFPVDERPDPLLLQSLVQSGFETLCLSIPLNRLTLREQTFPFLIKLKSTILSPLNSKACCSAVLLIIPSITL